MYCPECGNDAADAKFCPECGADLAGVKSALKGKTTAQQGGRGGQGVKGADRQTAAAPAKSAGRGVSPAVIWGGFGAVAVVVIVVVVMLSGGFGGNKSGNGSTPTGTASVQPVQGVTTGSYRELVQKGNELYDKGDAAFQSQNFDQGSAYFQAAAMTYAAAWKKQQTDPSLGTDLATSLFYSGDIDAALKQVNLVIEKFPDFQAAYFNLGNYLAHKARIAEQAGDAKTAKVDHAAAAVAYTKAVSLDPASDVGKEADARLKELPK
jgi:hypothetical protein